MVQAGRDSDDQVVLTTINDMIQVGSRSLLTVVLDHPMLSLNAQIVLLTKVKMMVGPGMTKMDLQVVGDQGQCICHHIFVNGVGILLTKFSDTLQERNLSFGLNNEGRPSLVKYGQFLLPIIRGKPFEVWSAVGFYILNQVPGAVEKIVRLVAEKPAMCNIGIQYLFVLYL